MTTTIDGVEYYTEEELEALYEKKCDDEKDDFMGEYNLELEIDGETCYGKED